jgi:hypothetical protein
MKTTEENRRINWRARLHSLPAGMEATSPIVSGILRSFLCLGLVLAGSLFVLISGACVGLSRGVGPEQTGGALYILPGLVLNLFAGAAIAAFVARRSAARNTSRLVFYTFTAPSFLAVALLALSFTEHPFH